MIRDLELKDVPRLKELHEAKPFRFDFPKLDELLTCKVFVDDNDVPKMMIGAQQGVEILLVSDPEWETPGMRMGMLRAMYVQVEDDLRRQGVKYVGASIPPEICKGFVRRLRREFGWINDQWTSVVGMVRY